MYDKYIGDIKLKKLIKDKNIFYHTCRNKDVKSILNNGLLRKKSKLWVASGGVIYLTKEPIWLCNNDDYTILKIELPKKFILNTEIWHIDDYLLNNDEWQFICWKDIPSKYIKIYKGGKDEYRKYKIYRFK